MIIYCCVVHFICHFFSRIQRASQQLIWLDFCRDLRLYLHSCVIRLTNSTVEYSIAYLSSYWFIMFVLRHLVLLVYVTATTSKHQFISNFSGCVGFTTSIFFIANLYITFGPLKSIWRIVRDPILLLLSFYFIHYICHLILGWIWLIINMIDLLAYFYLIFFRLEK